MCLRSFRTLWQTTALNYSILDDESRETWLCPPHDRLVNDALQRRYKDLGIKVRRSREGWVWIDNLTHIVFGWTP